MIAGRDYLTPIDADPEKDRSAWLAARMQGHGGSDTAAIVGEHPNKGPIDVWRAHCEGYFDDNDNERSRAGRFLEPHVLDWFARGGDAWPRSGGPLVVCKPPTVYHRDRPWQLGSADGLMFAAEAVSDLWRPDDEGLTKHGGLAVPSSFARGVQVARLIARRPDALGEVKTHGWFGSRGYSLDDNGGDPVVSVPPDKRIQCAWYMELYDVDLTYLAALVDTHLRRTFAIPRDRELGAMLLTEVEQFRRKYIMTGIAPPPDGKSSYHEYLKQRFKTHSAELVNADHEVNLAAAALIAIKRDMKKLGDDRELAEQVLKRAIGGSAGVKTASGVVTWKSQRSGKYRDKDMRAELYKIAGWTDVQISEFEDRYSQPDHRVLRTPSK